MKFLAIFTCSYLLIALCKLVHADIRSHHYTVDHSLDNKVSNTSVLAEYQSLSLTECAAKCGEHCCCFSFNVQKRKCRIRQACDTADMTTEETGWRYYSPTGMLFYIPYITYTKWVYCVSKLISY
jgi:hypothetical protein